MATAENGQGEIYEPEQLKLLHQAYDEAWASIAANFGDDPAMKEAIRKHLAGIVLNFPRDEIGDVEQIKNSALQVLALTYKELMPKQI